MLGFPFTVDSDIHLWKRKDVRRPLANRLLKFLRFMKVKAHKL